MTTQFIIFNIFLLAVIAVDLGLVHKKSHEVSVKEALLWCGLWMSLALIFAAGVFIFQSHEAGFQFLTGYIIEQSLSVDNILIFILIFRYFKVPKIYQHNVLFWGVLGALFMRLSLILIGAHIIQKYHWILYVFGAFLLFTGLKLLFSKDGDQEIGESYLVKWLKRVIPTSKQYDGKKFFTRENGRRLATPLFLVLILIESMDLIFAIDSIPAIFAITQDPFIIYTSNAFALMGLRSLYFALADLINRFHHLKTGLAFILIFIGIKMLTEPWIHISSGVSLSVTISILAIAILASLRHPPSVPPKLKRK